MRSFFEYWFWPNPAGWAYSDQKVVIALLGCGLLVLLSFLIRWWRSSVKNHPTLQLSRGWPRTSFWLGFVGLFLIISRVEMIQFIEMRALWVVWFLSLSLYVLSQVLKFRHRHYTVVASPRVVDERDKYLPRRKIR